MIKNNKFNPQMCKKQPDIGLIVNCFPAAHAPWRYNTRFRHLMFLCAA